MTNFFGKRKGGPRTQPGPANDRAGAADLGSALYIDTENLQSSAKSLIESLIENWPDTAPPVKRMNLYVQADRAALWDMWAVSHFPSLTVTVRGIQHYSARQSKNSADIAICIDAIADYVMGLSKYTVVLSDDSDFMPLYAKLKEMGGEKAAFLWVVTDRPRTKSSTADEYFPSDHMHIQAMGARRPAARSASSASAAPARPSAARPSATPARPSAARASVTPARASVTPARATSARASVSAARPSATPARASANAASPTATSVPSASPSMAAATSPIASATSPPASATPTSPIDSPATADAKPPTPPPAEKDESLRYAEMAELILEKLEPGHFKSTDCQPIIRRRWPDHAMVRMTSARFGTEFAAKVWPLLEQRGVRLSSTSPRKYELTDDIKSGRAPSADAPPDDKPTPAAVEPQPAAQT